MKNIDYNKKYRVIKPYPNKDKNVKFGDIIKHNGSCNTWLIAPEWPEYFEEIKNETYKVITYFDGYNDFYQLSSGKWTISFQYEYTEEELLKRRDIVIKSVKRLCDNEMFTIGDKVKYKNGNFSWNIDNFFIREDNVMLVRSKDNINVEEISTIVYAENEYPKIISFRSKNGDKNIFKLNEDEYYESNPGLSFTLESMLHVNNCVDNGWFEIYQIKVAENLIFTIGDKVTNPTGLTFTISKFYYNCTNTEILCNGKNTGNGHINVNKITKLNPLFITEDEVEIFEGDEYYFVNEDNWEFGAMKAMKNCNSSITFSSCDLARKYVLNNKPRFSKKQIEEALANSTLKYTTQDYGWNDFIEKLENDGKI